MLPQGAGDHKQRQVRERTGEGACLSDVMMAHIATAQTLLAMGESAEEAEGHVSRSVGTFEAHPTAYTRDAGRARRWQACSKEGRSKSKFRLRN